MADEGEQPVPQRQRGFKWNYLLYCPFIFLVAKTLIERIAFNDDLENLIPPDAILEKSIPRLRAPLCTNWKTIEEWNFKRKFRPQSGSNEPIPIRYLTEARNARRISVLDVDRRDIEIELWLDDIYKGYRDVDLNATVDCGRDIIKCIELDFGSGAVEIPPGKHMFRAEIRKRNASAPFDWGWQKDLKDIKKRIGLKVEECFM